MSHFSCPVALLMLSIVALAIAGCGVDSGPNSTADSFSATSGASESTAAPMMDFSGRSTPAASSPVAGSLPYTGAEAFVDVETAPVERTRVSELATTESAKSATYGTAPLETVPLKPAEEKPFAPNNSRQSGLLTAGSFDDVEKFGDYMDFLRRSPHQVQQCQLPLPPATQQTIISVTDLDGKPLGNVRCVVKQTVAGQTERVLLDRKTASDGRVMLLSDGTHCQTQQSQPLHLLVFHDNQSEAVIDEFRDIDRQWCVTLQNVQSILPTQLDLALVVDTTGSMGDELDYLKTEIDSIAASVKHMFPNIDQRFALITYRDNGDEYVCRSFDFTGSLSEFRRNLDAQSARGGGDLPEAMDVALQSAGQLTWRDANTARVLFLVGDAPPHSRDAGRAMTAITGLSELGVRIFPVGASGVDKSAEVILRTASLLSMGQYLFLTDHSGVGNPHATPDVPKFAVERLDRLMLRMIASELVGKRLVAEEVIAIERGEHYSYQAPVRFQSQTPSMPAPQCCIIVPQRSPLTMMVEWFGQNLLFSIVAIVSGAIVFARLANGMSTCEV